jgi:hypothetical protein
VCDHYGEVRIFYKASPKGEVNPEFKLRPVASTAHSMSLLLCGLSQDSSEKNL